MNKNDVFVLFGNKKSLENYSLCIDQLLQHSPTIDYVVKHYTVSDYENSKDFITTRNLYQEFVFISQREFDIIFHHLCSTARMFMKTYL